jgi:DNA excision repair protein ERCC-3
VSGGTTDQDFASKRQRFLAEQGYAYEIREAGDREEGDWLAGGKLGAKGGGG